jgi:hypothetical protein
MSVERRYGCRRPIDLDVQVRYRRRHFSIARGRNLSVDGMYLTIPSVTLPAGTMVELELEAAGKRWLIAAIVVHRHRSGIGVMFREHQPGLFQALFEAPGSCRPPRPGGTDRRPIAGP